MAISGFSSKVTTQIYSNANWYGIAGLEASSPDLTRIGGDMTLHASLPVQSLMKACILNDNGTVNYYLKADDWTKKVDGSASKLDGTDGQVMIEIPEHYYLDWLDGTVQRSAISLENISGFNHAPKMYIGAYEAVAQRSTKKLCSFKNAGVDFRGGNNNDAWDAGDNTLLGKCVTQLPIQEDPAVPGESFRVYAQNRGSLWYPLPWKLKSVINRLFMIEYATKNCQKDVNAVLTAEGYKQGGLGLGATTMIQADLNTFNSAYPFIPVGQSDSLASASGEVTYSVPLAVPVNVNIARYRGIENIFGHMMEVLDGIAIEKDLDNSRLKVWLFDSLADFKSNGNTNGRLVGYIANAAGAENIKSISLNDMVPLTVSSGDTTFETYFCDGLHHQNANVTSNYNHVRSGGYATTATISKRAGIFWLKMEDTFSLAFNYIGSRLACFPNGY